MNSKINIKLINFAKLQFYEVKGDFLMKQKYRAWDIHNNDLLELSGLGFDSQGEICYLEIEKIPGEFELISPIGTKIVQSTGLRDMYQNEIFIGDIVQVNVNQEQYMIKEVIWLNGACRVTTFDILDVDLAKKSVVVGNIFENKELLN